LKHNGLSLNKNIISNFSKEEAKGGIIGITGTIRTFSCFADADTNCGALTGTCMTALGCPYSVECPPTEICIPSISCQPNGIC
ncbi:MAG: hypothetical protein AAF617_18465, partial [Bacteroidota bacterium]